MQQAPQAPARAFGLPPGLGRLGRFAAGSMLASANAAARGFHLGLRAGAKTAQMVTSAAGPKIPGTALARQAVERVDAAATEAADEASQMTRRSLDLLRGTDDRQAEEETDAAAGDTVAGDTVAGDTVAGDTVAGDPVAVAPQSTLAELAADTVAAPLRHLASLTVALSTDVIRSAVDTPPARRALDTFLKRLSHGDEQRQALVVVATDSGVAVVRGGFSLAELALRLPFGDTRRLREILAASLEEMETLASSVEMHDLLPVPVVDAKLGKNAQRVIDRAPRRFLAALDETSPQSGSRPAEIFRALLTDADHLRVFAVAYPQTVLLMASNVGKLVTNGTVSFQDIEAFLDGRRRVTPLP